jgi:hypothetical protein
MLLLTNVGYEQDIKNLSLLYCSQPRLQAENSMSFINPKASLSPVLLTHSCWYGQHVVGNMKNLVAIEEEMLCALALGRWIAGQRQFELAKIFVNNYRNISLSLSAAENPDVLGVGHDLMNRDWYRVL